MFSYEKSAIILIVTSHDFTFEAYIKLENNGTKNMLTQKERTIGIVEAIDGCSKSCAKSCAEMSAALAIPRYPSFY